jgi:uncharacterized protein YwgA
MNPARIELQLALVQAGIPKVTLATFSERLTVQKKVYLTQLMGYDLGYRFGWYLRGPYCRELTVDAFTLKDELAAGDKDYEQYRLSDEALAQVQKAERLWANPKNLRVTPDQWLELLASLHYLKHIAYWPREATKDFASVFEKLASQKPHFRNYRVDAELAWKRLNEFGLVERKKLA